ncbi:glycosyltransferase family 4 protein [Hyunsoonleella rubra]|uniref:Glycosyltransferase family 4 protein n=1 Tax=Hyunsoonleella rubra TaxID=1737062 RepID=A0ABW5TBQ6_9FLAO
MTKKKIIRITTVSGSLTTLLKGQMGYVSPHFDVITISSPDSFGRLEKLEKSEGVKSMVVPMTRKITPLKDLIAVYRLYKIMRREKPHIVHSHTPKAGTLGMLAAWIARVPNRLHTIAGLPLVEAEGFKRKLLIFVEKITYACATKIYPNSYGLKDIILEEKIAKPSKLKIIGNGSSNGIDTTHFDRKHFSETERDVLRKKYNINKNDFVFVFVGRLVKDKGINELISAFDALNKKHDNLKLLLVGGYEKQLDPLLPETTTIIESNPNIIETGWADDVRPYYTISNALAFPSYREGFPNVVMQACAMELASIVTDINGCNEVITQDENGFIIPKKDREALYNAMEHIVLNQEGLKNMGQRSREIVIKKYEQKFVWKSILEEYNQL